MGMCTCNFHKCSKMLLSVYCAYILETFDQCSGSSLAVYMMHDNHLNLTFSTYKLHIVIIFVSH